MNDVAFEVEALRQLRGVVCSTPRCRANAYGIGRILTDGNGHAIEFACPDCNDPMLIGSRDVDDLVRALAEAASGDREELARRWVTPRIGDVHPCRARDDR